MSITPTPNPAGVPPASLAEYEYVSQQGTDTVGIITNVGGVPTDPDGSVVLVALLPDVAGSTPVFSSRQAKRVTVGTYNVTFAPADTQTSGYYHLSWTYTINSAPQVFLVPVQIGGFSPAYDRLPASIKALIERVWDLFADSPDSALGGPALQNYFQSKFNRGRIAQLMQLALDRLNTQMAPIGTFSLDGLQGPQFDLLGYGGLLVVATYIEVIKHLIRSYVEEPLIEGSTVARTNRRDYIQRWQQVLDSEQQSYNEMLSIWKIGQMFKTQPRVLVSGGVFGNYGPTRLAGSAAARPRYWTRFYMVLLLTGIALGGIVAAWHARGSSIHPSTSGNASINQVVQMPVGHGQCLLPVVVTDKLSCNRSTGLLTYSLTLIPMGLFPKDSTSITPATTLT